MVIDFNELKKQPILCVSKLDYQTNIVDKTNSSEADLKPNNKNLLLALSGLAVIGLSFLYLRKSKFLSENSTKTVIDYAKENLLNKEKLFAFVKKIPKKNQTSFHQSFTKYKNIKPQFASFLSNTENSLDVISGIFAGQEAGLKNFIQLPNTIYMSGVENNTRKTVTRMLADFYEADFKSTKYTQGYAKVFVQMMEEQVQKTKKPTFVYLENMESLLNDLNKPENEELLNSFKNVLKAGEDNNIVYVLNKDLDHASFERKQINFEFLQSINNEKFEKKLEELNNKQHHNNFMLESDIVDDSGKYLTNGVGFGFKDNSKTPNIWMFSNSQNNYIDKLLAEIVTKTGDKYKKLSAGEDINNVINILKEQMTKAKVHFDMTKEKTYLFIDDIEKAILKCEETSPEIKELSELLKKAKDNNLTVILPNNENKIIEQIISKNDKVIQSTFDIEKIRKNFLNYSSLGETGKYLKKKLDIFIELFKIEQTGRPIPKMNGILMYGNAEKVNKGFEILKHSLDVSFRECKYDSKEPFESIKKLVGIAKKGEEQFKDTHKRTMIYLDGWEDLLTHDEMIENRRIIAYFKQFVEHCSERYHTTVLLKTVKNLEEFEPASIGTQRFEHLIKLS